jgi:hypothetical protein
MLTVADPMGKEAEKMSKIIILMFRSVKGKAAVISTAVSSAGKNIQKEK